MKPLDIVKTKHGNIAIISETSRKGKSAAIKFIGDNTYGTEWRIEHERVAWYDEEELEVIDSLPSLLARMACDDVGNGNKDAEYFYPQPGLEDE